MDKQVWEVRWIPMERATDSDRVNQVLADVAAGWEPFAAMPDGDGWILMVKRKVES